MKMSAGILMFRKDKNFLEVLLVHPGGPFWKNKDGGAWSVPKGEIKEGEEAFAAAVREFEEELGTVPTGNFFELLPVKQKSGKTVQAWAVEADFDTAQIKSNYFEMEWPPRSGQMVSFPEVDKADWFSISDAKEKINNAQVSFLDQLSGIAD